MRVYLTFDVELWCNAWDRLDERFLAAFQRYVYGRSPLGDYALPKTLEILERNQLKGVFFVEPLFAARFGIEHLKVITSMIRDAGQDIQLHCHTEWIDELPNPPISNHGTKRQHLSHHSLDEQTAILGFAKSLLSEVGIEGVDTFRAGSFACNRDTYTALRRNGLTLDSSLNACSLDSGNDLRRLGHHEHPSWIDGVYSVPVSIFRDGTGRIRSAQINGSGAAELEQALVTAAMAGQTDFVIVSHNFEMLKPGTADPDPLVVRRFERLCRFLAVNAQDLPTSSFALPHQPQVPCAGPGAAHQESMKSAGTVLARCNFPSTLVRHAEQAWRRL